MPAKKSQNSSHASSSWDRFERDRRFADGAAAAAAARKGQPNDPELLYWEFRFRCLGGEGGAASELFAALEPHLDRMGPTRAAWTLVAAAELDAKAGRGPTLVRARIERAAEICRVAEDERGAMAAYLVLGSLLRDHAPDGEAGATAAGLVEAGDRLVAFGEVEGDAAWWVAGVGLWIDAYGLKRDSALWRKVSGWRSKLVALTETGEFEHAEVVLERLDAIDGGVERQFVELMVEHLREENPELLSTVHDSQVKLMVVNGIERARKHRLSSEESMMVFVSLMFAVAPNFDDHPAVKKMLDTEAGGAPTADQRVKELTARLSDREWQEASRLYDGEAWFSSVELPKPKRPDFMDRRRDHVTRATRELDELREEYGRFRGVGGRSGGKKAG